MKMYWVSLLLIILCSNNCFSQNIWECNNYSDEAGFQSRIKNAFQLSAEKGFGKLCLSESKCPDTGLPVYTYAIEGEEIISPYTGRRYIQPATGYFSAQKRNENGEITAFGGDVLKYDLLRVMACLKLGIKVDAAKSYLSIPGIISQQYHFACKNWARFYPLFSDLMGDEWKKKFYNAVANYSENKRVSDDLKSWLKLSYPHDLVGQQSCLLGGNSIEGGTENHKIMWRTSALLYAQLFPDTAHISGHTTRVAEKLTKEMIRNFAKKLVTTGNGEYDSSIYYPHSIEGFLNLYDFSPDKETRLIAKFVLDYYFATYGLKVVNGTIAGAQKRGYITDSICNGMETLLWCFAGVGTRDMSKLEIPFHIATTTYRPNQLIINIIQKKLSVPFEAKMSRPFYQMDKGQAFAESLYSSNTYTLGNSQTSIMDNPNQQVVWSLVAKGEKGSLSFTGSQPIRGALSGQSPYTQTFQSKGTLVILTADTKINSSIDTTSPPTPKGMERANYWLLSYSDHPKKYELVARQKYGYMPLEPIIFPKNNSEAELLRFWTESKKSASTWLVYPKCINFTKLNGRIYFETPTMRVAILPICEKYQEISLSRNILENYANHDYVKVLSNYNLISFAGKVSGYIMETAEKSVFKSLILYDQFLTNSTNLSLSEDKLIVNYKSSYGEKLIIKYQPDKLRPDVKVNGKRIDFDNYTNGAVYESPYIKVKNGEMYVSDGISSYKIDFKGNLPIYK